MTFEQWLQRNGYRDTTKQLSLRQVARAKALLRGPAAELPRSYEDTIQRYLRYFDEAGGAATWFEQRLRALGYTPATTGRKQAHRRASEARSYSDADWRTIADAIAADTTPEACVLAVIMSTGLRVGDVLATPYSAIAEGVHGGAIPVEVKGGQRRYRPVQGTAWPKLHAAMQQSNARAEDNVARWVCPDGDGSPHGGQCAYQRVNRRLKQLAAAAGITGRIHLHRMRRTVAVQALRETGDIIAVQQLLDHSSIRTTYGYLDEAREKDVANLQAKLGKFRGHE